MMKFIGAIAICLAMVTPVQAKDRAKDHIDMQSCTASGDVNGLAICVATQTEICVAGVEPSGDCHILAHEQSEALLEGYYEAVVFTTKVMELTLQGRGYTGQEAMLRASQAAWIEMRDLTCGLKVAYAATGVGQATEVARCKARLNMQRMGDLENELGVYLN